MKANFHKIMAKGKSSPAAPAASTPEGKGGGKRWVLVLIGIVLLLLVGLGVGIYMYTRSGTTTTASANLAGGGGFGGGGGSQVTTRPAGSGGSGGSTGTTSAPTTTGAPTTTAAPQAAESYVLIQNANSAYQGVKPDGRYDACSQSRNNCPSSQLTGGDWDNGIYTFKGKPVFYNPDLDRYIVFAGGDFWNVQQPGKVTGGSRIGYFNKNDMNLRIWENGSHRGCESHGCTVTGHNVSF